MLADRIRDRNERFTWNRAEITLGAAGPVPRGFVVDPAGALWCERHATLIVSDLHLEKGSFFAARGQFLPPYDTAETLHRLGLLIRHYGPRRVIALGDSFHDRRAVCRMAETDRATLAALQRGRDWTWITGNHDEDIDQALPGERLAELTEEGLRFVHIPGQGQDGLEIAGHLHPCAVIRLRGRGQRRRALVACGRRIVMPAFGAFTGGLNLRDRAVSGLFAGAFSALVLGSERVFPVPPALCQPD